jgi:hypothetical protein
MPQSSGHASNPLKDCQQHLRLSSVVCNVFCCATTGQAVPSRAPTAAQCASCPATDCPWPWNLSFIVTRQTMTVCCPPSDTQSTGHAGNDSLLMFQLLSVMNTTHARKPGSCNACTSQCSCSRQACPCCLMHQSWHCPLCWVAGLLGAAHCGACSRLVHSDTVKAFQCCHVSVGCCW